jgi:deoxyribose-phosphate aldolase
MINNVSPVFITSTMEVSQSPLAGQEKQPCETFTQSAASEPGIMKPGMMIQPQSDELSTILADISQTLLDKMEMTRDEWNALPGKGKLDRLVALFGSITNLNKDITVAKYIDHTNLKLDATEADIRKLCAEAKENRFTGVCIYPRWVSLASQLLRDTPVKVVTVVGFPTGSERTDVKVAQTEKAVRDGAEEIDMVINVDALKAGKDRLVFRDIADVVEAAQGKVVKVIIETGKLTDREKVKACHLIKGAGAEYVKTCTGFVEGSSANVHDIELLRNAGHGSLYVKASGGIKSLRDASALIVAGASRLGTSKGMEIVKEEKALKDALGNMGRKVLDFLVDRDPDYHALRDRISAAKQNVLSHIRHARKDHEPVYYLAGPVNTNEKSTFYENLEHMEGTAGYLEEQGYELVVPGNIEKGILKDGKPLPNYGLNYFLFMDDQSGLWPEVIKNCDGMKFCMDWKYSKGASDEYYIGQKAGLKA